MRKLVSFLIVCFPLSMITQLAHAGEVRPLPANLASTLDLYLSADESYRSGDLITQSQLREFQIYLRRTRGASLATHQKWSKMALADRAGLTQLFHNGGAVLLRRAVQQTGSFADLDKLARTPRGQTLLNNAIKNNDLEQLMQAIEQHKEKEPARKAGEVPKKSPPKPEKVVIYTADDFLAELNKAVETRQSAASTAETVQVDRSGQPQGN